MNLRLIKRKKQNRSLGGNLFVRSLLVLICIFMVFPLVFAVSNAFKPMDELFLFPPRFFVRNPTLENFHQLFILISNSWVPFSRYVFNSFFITAAGTGGHVVFASMAAYVLAKHKFPGQATFNNLAVISIMFSPYVLSIPNYLIMTKLGWINTYLPLIIPAVAYPVGLFLMTQFMNQIPDATLQSARVDGAGEFRIFWEIVMPSVKPAWLTLIVFSFQILWNNQGSMYIFNEELKPLPYALSQILLGGIARTGPSAVVSLFIMLVPITVFLLTQGSIVQTMTTSGLKE